MDAIDAFDDGMEELNRILEAEECEQKNRLKTRRGRKQATAHALAQALRGNPKEQGKPCQNKRQHKKFRVNFENGTYYYGTSVNEKGEESRYLIGTPHIGKEHRKAGNPMNTPVSNPSLLELKERELRCKRTFRHGRKRYVRAFSGSCISLY